MPLVGVFDVSLFVVEVSKFVEHHCCHYDQCTCLAKVIVAWAKCCLGIAP